MALDKLGFVRKNYDLYNVSLWNTVISLRESRESSYWQFFHKSPAMCTPKLPLGNMYFTMIISMIEPPPWKKMQSLGIIIPFLWLNIKNCVNCEITNQSIWLYPQEKKKQDLPMFPTNITQFSPITSRSDLFPARLRQASLPFTNLVQSFPPSPGHMIATFPVGC